ncbi:MAG: thrombospondin type 3 repeat-containing protein [Theionarchaea archaeon]|nr:thrombospondin type 3 repeat-containing protein [Theionarchaea archaeon]
MKALRVTIMCLVLISLCAVTPEPSSCAANLTINKGCGATYYVNELILISYSVSGSPGDSITVTLKDKLADGTIKVIFANKSILPNIQYFATGVVAPPYGTETLILEWTVTTVSPPMSATGMEMCNFIVATGPGGAPGTTLRVDSNVSNFQVFFDGAYIHTTPYSYTIFTLSPGISGPHTVTLKKTGCTDASKTVNIIPGVANQVTITMDCGPGGGEEPADFDGDGVPDDQDACYNPDCNIVDSRGCPKDQDRDGLNDCDDQCPTEAGAPADDGCPAKDKDNDGVTDDQDACYNPECSLVDSSGCPRDTDNDGLNDCEDECPSEYGERRNDGCPEEDADNDGVTDDQDNCYNPGCNLVDSRGCPWDSDNDGINDCEDNCPNQSGPRSNYGCPEEGPQLCLGTGLLTLLVIIGGIFVSMRRK